MQLSDLFVSHKQVEPVSFNKTPLNLPKPIYLNRERAQAVTTEPTQPASEDTSSWQTQYPETFNWKVMNSDVVTSPNPATPSKGWSNPYKGNKDKWIADITAAYKRTGLNDNAIKNLIAKNALESGWGNSARGDFNFGNITPGSNWTGRFVTGNDHNAAGQAITQKFRAYNSIDDFVKDEVSFLTSLYDFNPNDDFDTFIGKLQGNNKGKRRYAEATNYTSAVRNVYDNI